MDRHKVMVRGDGSDYLESLDGMLLVLCRQIELQWSLRGMVICRSEYHRTEWLYIVDLLFSR